MPPYSRKWRQFRAGFDLFYGGAVSITADQPYSLFEMPRLGVVVAGLNSTMAQGHRAGDNYGLIGEDQLQWFAARLGDYKDNGWLRIAAVHHHISRAVAGPEESLSDLSMLDDMLGKPNLVNLLMHGHATDGAPGRLASGLMTLSAGTAPGTPDSAAPPNQYQIITVSPDNLRQHARKYDACRRLWVGDSRVNQLTRRHPACHRPRRPPGPHLGHQRRSESPTAMAASFAASRSHPTAGSWPPLPTTARPGSGTPPPAPPSARSAATAGPSAASPSHPTAASWPRPPVMAQRGSGTPPIPAHRQFWQA